MAKGIIFFGAAGAGKSALGNFVSKKLNYSFFDLDDFFWRTDTEIPFTVSVPPEIRFPLLMQEVSKSKHFILSGNMTKYSAAYGFNQLFELAVFVTTPTDLRIQRIRTRELARFGDRVTEGDMFEVHEKFIEWAKIYDDTAFQSLHEQWIKTLPCPVLFVDGTKTLDENAKIITDFLQEITRLKDIIGTTVTVTMDRPIGTEHPKHKGLVYPINYGYIEGLFAGDGEEQDAYILGIHKPLQTFTGKVVAVVKRFDDVENKWVVAAENKTFSKEQIRQAIHFQEKYYKTEIIIR